MGFLINDKLIKKNIIVITAIFAIFLFTPIVLAADNAQTYVAGSSQKNQSTVYSMMNVNFTSNWTDDTKLSNWTFETNNSGLWVNSTVVNFGTAASGSNITGYVLLVNANPGTNVSWRFWTYDNQTHLVGTGTQYFVVADNQPPLWTTGTLLTTGNNYYSSIMNFMSNWTDNTTLDSFIFEINQTGGYVNTTSAAFGLNNSMTNYTMTIIAAENMVVSWRFWVNDTSNNWNVTSLQTFIAGAVPSGGSGGSSISSGSSGGSSSTPTVNYTNYTYRCTDTDSAIYPTINYNVKGTSTVTRSDGKIMYTNTDYCTESTLTEYFCITQNSQSISKGNNICQYGCGNGACLQQQVVAPSPTCAENPSMPGCNNNEPPVLLKTRSPSTNTILWIVGGAGALVIIGMAYSVINIKKKK